MPTYLYRCKKGNHTFGATRHDLDFCPQLHGPAVRDYKAESVSVMTVPGASKDPHTVSDPSLFLPMAKDFEGPDDPDGMKGLRQWREEHVPMHKGGRHPEVG